MQPNSRRSLLVAVALVGLIHTALAGAQTLVAEAQAPVAGTPAPNSQSVETKPQGADSEPSKPWITFDFGLIVIGDYTWFSQDQASIHQVGGQESQSEFRADRILLRGNLFNTHSRPWHYLVALEYHGDDAAQFDEGVTFYDYQLMFPVGPLGDLTIGKMKETFSYEVVGDLAFAPYLERIQTPFIVTRSVGVRLNKVLAGERATVAAGAFNDWYDKGIPYTESAWDFTARVTGLPVWDNDGRRFLHLGGAWRYQGADQGVVRFKGQPESHVASNYVDTGNIPALHANDVGAEVFWNEGPMSVLGEYIASRVSSVEARDPAFSGWYVTGSWVVTGETRPYDRNVGYARKVTPSRRGGAVELAARYSAEDLTDQSIDGGRMTKWFAGVSYYLNQRWRFNLGQGWTTLDKNGITGKTTQTLARVQWVY
jgi:phosphate-selective porin OprO/OprP